MKKIYLFSLLLFLAGNLLAQKTFNDPNAEVRHVKSFHALKVSTGIEVILMQGDTEGVAVSAADIEYRDRIRTEVVNGVLKIYHDKSFVKVWKLKGKRLKAYVSAIKINNIDISSGALVKVEGTLNSESMNIDASSGAVFKGSITAASVKIGHSSGAVVEMSGSAGRLAVDGSSGGHVSYKGEGVTTKIKTSSGGRIFRKS